VDSFAIRVAAAAAAMAAAGAAYAGDWTFYRRDLMGTSNSPEPLSADDAAGFTGNWTAFTHGWNYANPIVANGVVYLTSGDGNLYAFDESTGAQLWHKPAEVDGPFSCIDSPSKGPIGAPAAIGSRVFMPGADGVIYAYDTTGNLLWQTKIANPAEHVGEFLWTSAFPLKGRVYFGVSSLHDCVLVPGRMVALDQETGVVTGTWWADANHGPGGGVWTQPAYDERTNRFFMTTGTIAPGLTPAQQPLADAFVAIDPDTMETLDSFSPVAGLFGEDLDFGASPTLFDTNDPDHPHMIAAANKNGVVYALDRDNLQAGVVWSYTISGSGASPDVGESTIVSAPYANGMLFVGGGKRSDGRAGAVAALDAATGAEKWLKPLDEFVLAAMTTVGDVLIFGASTPNIFNGSATYVVEQATGKTLFTMPGHVFFGEPTYANGQLLVGDLGDPTTTPPIGGALYALIPGNSPITPDFVLSVSPPSQTLGAGTTATFNVSTTSAQPVALSVSSLPSGVSGSFSSPTVSAGHDVSLVLSANAGSANGSKTSFVVTGSAAATHVARASVGVVASDFSLTTPPLAALVSGQQIKLVVVTNVTQGAPETIALSISGLPAGVSAGFDPPSVVAGGSSTLTISAARDAAVVSRTADVAAVAPSNTHHTALAVRIVVAPSAQVTSPAAGAVVSGHVGVAVTASAAGGTTLASVALLVDGSPVGSSQSSPATIPWNATSVTAGEHHLAAVAEDALGVQGTSAPVTVIVDDLVAPTISLDAGSSSGSVSGTVDLHAKATGSGNKSIARLDVLVDGTVVQSANGGDVQVPWDTKTVRDGPHTIVATAVDSAGRSGSSPELTLTTANGSTSLSVGGKSGGCATSSSSPSAALVSLLAVAVWKRRRSR
jgi:outer membrane protein assembly factor BamB/archaellum component FlaF (FlaF/FlaG flagellin family)